MFQTKSSAFFVLLLLCLLGFSLRAGATAPSYSVSVGSGSFSPNPIYNGMTATASLSASLNVQNPNQEIQENGDRWSWSAVVTGYASSSQSAFGAVPSGVTPPAVSATSGSAKTTVSATAGQNTTPGAYQVTVTATDSFTVTDNTTSPATVTSQSQSGSATLQITVAIPAVTITLGDHVQNGHSITGTIALSSPSSLPGSFTVGLIAKNAPPPSPQTNPPTPPATGMVSVPSSVTVPGDGTSVSFTVKGTSVSAFLNDVYVTASSGATSNNASLTVWSPGPAECKATPHDSYFVATTINGKLVELGSPDPPHDAVDLIADAGITPKVAPLSWLNSAYPSGAQVGLVQNMQTAVYADTYSDPQIAWNSNVPKGTVGYAYSGWTDTITVPASVDTDDNTPYPRPYDPLVPITQQWSSSDDPSTILGAIVTKPLLAADYTTVLGYAKYVLQKVSIKASFTDWCCIFINGSATFPATTGWSVNASGAPPGPGVISPAGSISIGSGGGYPITYGYDSNQYLADYAGIDPSVTSPLPPVRLSYTK